MWYEDDVDIMEDLARVKCNCLDAVLQGKATAWGKQLTAAGLWQEMFISGGFIASHIQNKPHNDIDIYFKTEEAMKEANKIISAMDDYIAMFTSNYGVAGTKLATANATTMVSGHSFIWMISGSPQDVKKTFDFVHCTPHYDVLEGKLYISERQYALCKRKELVVNRADGVVDDKRSSKFLKRGYTFDIG